MQRIFTSALVVLTAACSSPGDGSAAGSESSTAAGSTGSTSDDPTTTSTSDAATTSTTDASSSSSGGPPLEGYDDPALWLCHPDKAPADDACLGSDLTMTELLPDGSTALVEHEVAADPAFDCFYVYPTVDLRLTPGQTENFNDIDQELDPLLNQAARLTSMCRVFAPLYHQVTIGTFQSPEAPALLDAAYQDVKAAFDSYLARHADERPLVILGHSQGTYMTTRLVQEVVEPDPALRGRLLAAVLLGGGVSVPPGQLVGGTFAELPLCSAPDELGCVLAWRTYAAELPPAPGNQSPDLPGNDVACTNPAALDGSPAPARGAIFPTFTHQELVFPKIDFGQPIDTPFVLLRDFYRFSCEADSDGLHFLAIAPDPAPGDLRSDPIDVHAPLLGPEFLGLHVFDYNYAAQDILALIAAKAAAAGL